MSRPVKPSYQNGEHDARAWLATNPDDRAVADRLARAIAGSLSLVGDRNAYEDGWRNVLTSHFAIRNARIDTSPWSIEIWENDPQGLVIEFPALTQAVAQRLYSDVRLCCRGFTVLLKNEGLPVFHKSVTGVSDAQTRNEEWEWPRKQGRAPTPSPSTTEADMTEKPGLSKTISRTAALAQFGQSCLEAENQAGVDPRRLTTRGAGAAEPIAPNDNESGRAKNRRVELVRL